MNNAVVKNSREQLHDFLDSWIFSISDNIVGARVEPFLEPFESATTKINAILYVYDQRPDFKDSFKEWSKSRQSSRAEDLSFDAAIRSTGLNVAMSYLVACMLGERINIKNLQRDAKTKAFHKPLEQLFRWAHKSRMHFSEHQRYQDLAFGSGFFFDYIELKIEQNADPALKRKLIVFLENRFDLAIRASMIALKLSKKQERLIREKEVIPLIFLELASQAVHAIFDPSYIDFVNTVEKLQLSPAFEEFAEREKFKVHHSRFGLASLHAVPAFSRLGEVLHALSRPYMVSSNRNPDAFDLVNIVSFSIYLTKNRNSLSGKTGSVQAGQLASEWSLFDYVLVPKEVYE